MYILICLESEGSEGLSQVQVLVSVLRIRADDRFWIRCCQLSVKITRVIISTIIAAPAFKFSERRDNWGEWRCWVRRNTLTLWTWRTPALLSATDGQRKVDIYVGIKQQFSLFNFAFKWQKRKSCDRFSTFSGASILISDNEDFSDITNLLHNEYDYLLT